MKQNRPKKDSNKSKAEWKTLKIISLSFIQCPRCSTKYLWAPSMCLTSLTKSDATVVWTMGLSNLFLNELQHLLDTGPIPWLSCMPGLCLRYCYILCPPQTLRIWLVIFRVYYFQRALHLLTIRQILCLTMQTTSNRTRGIAQACSPSLNKCLNCYTCNWKH